MGFVGQRYHLLAPLGQGGMGKVVKALDRFTGQVVALKQVLSPSGADPDMAEVPSREPTQPALSSLPRVTRRLGPAATFDGSEPGSADFVDLHREQQRLALAQEFRTLASLRHPNIISVLDYGFGSDHQPFFTMELLEHATGLYEAAAELPLPSQVELICQILQALSYLHRHGIVHRDIKPANITSVAKGDSFVRARSPGSRTIYGQATTGNQRSVAISGGM